MRTQCVIPTYVDGCDHESFVLEALHNLAVAFGEIACKIHAVFFVPFADLTLSMHYWAVLKVFELRAGEEGIFSG